MRLVVAPDAAGARLDVALAEPLGSRSRAQRLIEAGQVLVDGAVAPKRHRVAAGEVIEVDETDTRPPPATASGDVPIVYEDADVLVVDKPAGLVVHPAPGVDPAQPTLSELLAGRAAGGAPERPGIVHRLDRDTSGLLVVARTEEAHRVLKRELEERAIEREYVALVEGRPPARTGTIDAPLGRDRRRRTRQSTDTDAPRRAVTRFAIEDELPGFTLLRVTLETGRTHQIRAHLLAIGHPVAGDPEYGTRGQLGLTRQFLHARRLAFTHPRTGERVEVASPVPADLASALAQLRSG